MNPQGRQVIRVLRSGARTLTAALTVCLALSGSRAMADTSPVAVEDAGRFADYLYLQLLFREADDPGRDFWQGAVESGAQTSQGVIGTFLDGEEYQQVVAPVARLYHSVLDRLPELGGQDYWVNRFRDEGEDLVRIAELFLESPEALGIYDPAASNEAFIETLYQTALDRASDPEGMAHWLAQMANGATRSEIVAEVSESAEHRALINSTLVSAQLAQALLGRFATGPELAQAASEPQSTVVDRFLKQGSSVSISILGLGDSIRVTSAPVAFIGGVASSGLDVAEVRWSGGDSAGIASGTERWEASIALASGDNAVSVTAVNRLGIGATMASEVTYDPAMALYSPLSPSRDVAYRNDPEAIVFSVGVDVEPEGELILLRDDNGTMTELTLMRDDGTGVDVIDSDGVFTASIVPQAAALGRECYRAQVSNGRGETYLSERACLWIADHLGAGAVSAAAQIAEDVERRFADADPEISLYDLADSIAAALPGAWNVAASGFSDSGAVWWVTADGLLGAYRMPVAGEKTGGDGGQPVLGAPTKPAISEYLFPVSYLADRSRWQAANAADFGLPLSEETAGTVARTLSGEGRIISPFIEDPFVADASFGGDDDFFGAWQTIDSAQSCAAFPTDEAVVDSTSSVLLNDFVSLGDRGYVHVSTHGDHYFGDLRDIWDEAWGPGAFLGGSRGLVLLESGVAMSFTPSGNFDFTVIEDDLVAKRVVVSAGGRLLLTPAFFDYYLPSLPNSLVVLSACRTSYDSSMINAYLRRGAAGVVAFSDTVSTSYAQQTTDSVIISLLGGNSLGQALEDAVADNGGEDGDATPAFLEIFGQNELTLAEKGAKNAGFERGASVGWEGAGVRSVITRLGEARPFDGLYMGIASTSAGASSDGGSLQQTMCLPDDVTTLDYAWNLFSAEFPGFCDSNFQDSVHAELCSVDADGVESGCQILLDRQVSDFCGATTPSSVVFDGQDTESTGWFSESADVSALAGQRVRVRFTVRDSLDRVYDSAILVDGLTVGSN